jgi:putative ABC transport system permease protein
MSTHFWLETLARDIHYSLRRGWRKPGFTLIAIITLALGIGATTAIFTVVNGVLIKPLPYPHPEALIGIWHSAVFQGTKIDKMNMSVPMYVAYEEENKTFEQIGIWSNGTSNVTGIGDPEQILALQVTNEILPALGVPPSIGRWFTRADDSPETPETVVLTYGYWQKRFGGDKGVIGRKMTIDSRPREIVGVMPQRFEFLNLAPDVILPQRFDRAHLPANYIFNYQGIARLRTGSTIGQATADVARMLQIWASRNGPDAESYLTSSKVAPALTPLKRDVVGDVDKLLWVLMGTVGLVLLMACANVANLIVVRMAGRRQEISICAALGAGWRRIVAQLMTESLVLALGGGIFGLVIAYVAVQFLRFMHPLNLPRLTDISIDLNVLAFSLGASLLSGLLFGIIPVMKYVAPQAIALRASRTATQSRDRRRVQNTLVVVQVALALVLIIGAGLMIRSFQALRNVQPGFTRPEQIQMLRIAIPATQVQEPERVIRTQNEILDKLSGIPGVTSAAFATEMPMEFGFQSSNLISIEDKPTDVNSLPIRRGKYVSPGLFKTQGTTLIAGRDFSWTDIYQQKPIVIVSENMARETWGSASAALGKRVRIGTVGEWSEIVGVAADVYDDGVHQSAPRMLYWRGGVQNFRQAGVTTVSRFVTFAVRSDRAGTESFLKEIRSAIWSVNPNLPLARVRTLDDAYRQSMSRTSFTLVMLAIAGSMALVLGIVGIYGVISYSISERVREIGIRLALGSQPSAVKLGFVGEGLLLTCVGLAIGAGTAMPLTRLMSSLLFGIRPFDAATYVVAMVFLLVAALLASYVPARRASSVDPIDALRSE